MVLKTSRISRRNLSRSIIVFQMRSILTWPSHHSCAHMRFLGHYLQRAISFLSTKCAAQQTRSRFTLLKSHDSKMQRHRTITLIQRVDCVLCRLYSCHIVRNKRWYFPQVNTKIVPMFPNSEYLPLRCALSIHPPNEERPGMEYAHSFIPVHTTYAKPMYKTYNLDKIPLPYV